MDSVKAIRYQASEVCDALEELADTTDDPDAKSDTQSLVNQLRNYKFLISLAFWHSLLFQVNFVSKELQSETMDVTTGLKTFREKGFEEALVDARELAEDLDVEAVFKSENRHVCKRR